MKIQWKRREKIETIRRHGISFGFCVSGNVYSYKKGYSPKEVDAFIEELKEKCRKCEEKYQELEQKFLMLQDTVQKEEIAHGSAAGKKTGD